MKHLLLLLAACGGSDGPTPDASTNGDALIDSTNIDASIDSPPGTLAIVASLPTFVCVGGTTTGTIALSKAPTGQIIVSASSSYTTAIDVDAPNEFTFDTSSWNLNQTITLHGYSPAYDIYINVSSAQLPVGNAQHIPVDVFPSGQMGCP